MLPLAAISSPNTCETAGPCHRDVQPACHDTARSKKYNEGLSLPLYPSLNKRVSIDVQQCRIQISISAPFLSEFQTPDTYTSSDLN